MLVCQYLPVAGLMFCVGKISQKIGRKEMCALGMLLAGAANLVLYFLHTDNPYIFLFVCFLSGIGSTFFFLQVWALVTDVIDDNEIKTGVREDATTYAFYSFTRKLGQTVAGILANAALIWVGYQLATPDGVAVAQTEATKSGIYGLSVLIPAVLYLVIFVALWFWYPLDKKAMAELQIKKEQRLKDYFSGEQETQTAE